jgi:hypothetical protein
MDTRDSILLEAQIREYEKGTSSSGTGPSSAHRNYRRGLDQATRYGRGISELGENLDGESAHRPPQKRKGKSSKCLLLQLRSRELLQQQTTTTSSVATLDRQRSSQT